MESLREYLTIAEKVCSAKKLATTDDIVSHIAEYIMRADTKYNPKIGTLSGWRTLYIKSAIKNWYKKLNSKKRKKEINNFDYSFQKDDTTDRFEKFIDPKPGPLDNLIAKESLNFVQSKLDEKEFAVITTLMDNYGIVAKSSRELKISRPHLHKKIKKIRAKLEGYKDVLV